MRKIPGYHYYVHIQNGGAWEKGRYFWRFQKKKTTCNPLRKRQSKTHKKESLTTVTPSPMAWTMPNLGTFLAQSGLKCSVRLIFPPLCSMQDRERWTVNAHIYRLKLWLHTAVRCQLQTYLYILHVFPSSSGMAVSGAVARYVTGI